MSMTVPITDKHRCDRHDRTVAESGQICKNRFFLIYFLELDSYSCHSLSPFYQSMFSNVS